MSQWDCHDSPVGEEPWVNYKFAPSPSVPTVICMASILSIPMSHCLKLHKIFSLNSREIKSRQCGCHHCWSGSECGCDSNSVGSGDGSYTADKEDRHSLLT